MKIHFVWSFALLLQFLSQISVASPSEISATASASGMNSWAACTSAETDAQTSVASQCAGKISDCEFTDSSRRLGDEKFTCSATCKTTCVNMDAGIDAEASASNANMASVN